MNATHASTGDQDEPGRYEIRIKGHLDDRWADWFDGLTITREDNGETCPVAVFEMIFAGWLIVKGFNPAAIAPASAKTATNELLSAA